MKTTVALVDDHTMVAEALSSLIQQFDDYDVLFVAENGRKMMESIQVGLLPDILILDLNMPVMNGMACLPWLQEHAPATRVVILSMNENEEQIVRSIREGAVGYVLKGCRPSELHQALNEIRDKGFYYSPYLSEQLVRSLRPGNRHDHPYTLNERELNFLRLACSDLTYAEIADKLCVSPRTVDGYREVVFQKMQVKSRVGMALEAVRSGLVEL
ncbi:MAG: response regulator transcription factor [Siphonobacter aquaeclarae]|jgi:two-component system invasion response regulator UvrY|nr:response regulator transcription factor [Siphonobacter aquaeclarae]